MIVRAVTLLVTIALGHASWAQPVQEASVSFGPEEAAEVLLVQGTTDIAQFEPVLIAFAATAPRLRIMYEQWASHDLYAVAAAACRGESPAADLLISSSIDLAPPRECVSSELAERSTGDQVALDVEMVVDGGVRGEEALRRAWGSSTSR